MAAVLWGGIAVIFNLVARKNINIYAFYGFSLFFGILCSSFFVHWGILFKGPVDRLVPLVLLNSFSGVLTMVATLLLIVAMGQGHSSLVWTITQSAIVVQFVYSTLFWNESLSLNQLLGLAAIFLNFVFISAGRSERDGQNGRGFSGNQLILVLSSFILNGIAQIMFIAPSHWINWQDTTGARVLLFYMVPGILMVWSVVRSGRKIDKAGVGLGFLMAVLSVAGMLLLSAALNIFALLRISKIVYPITTAGSIVLFAFYSFLFLGESFNLRKWSGIILGILGIILISV